MIFLRKAKEESGEEPAPVKSNVEPKTEPRADRLPSGTRKILTINFTCAFLRLRIFRLSEIKRICYTLFAANKLPKTNHVPPPTTNHSPVKSTVSRQDSR